MEVCLDTVKARLRAMSLSVDKLVSTHRCLKRQ